MTLAVHKDSITKDMATIFAQQKTLACNAAQLMTAQFGSLVSHDPESSLAHVHLLCNSAEDTHLNNVQPIQQTIVQRAPDSRIGQQPGNNHRRSFAH